jgi:hypothetical protein
MGLFKQMKDMKKTVEAAPGLMAQAQQMGAQAQSMQAAQYAAMQQQQAAAAVAAPPADGAFFEPIAGVSLELYADISRECAGRPGDLGHATMVASGRGVSAESWQAAMDGWNARMHNPSVAQRFNALYMQRG